MSLIFKICPCLTWVFKKKPVSPSKKYDGVNELEEQQFMHHLENEAMKLESENERPNGSTIQQQLNVQLGLSKQQHIQDYFKQTGLQEKSSSEAQQKSQLIDLSEQKKISFNLNIPEYDEYYSVLEQASKDIPNILSEEGYTQIALVNEEIFKSRLKAWSKTDTKGGKFILDFQLPCSYSYYEQISSKKINPKDNKIINDFQQIQSLKPNLNVKYLCLNKLSMLEPRDFTYLKYTNGVEGEHWQVCISKEDFHPSESKAKLGKIHLVSRITEQNQIIKVRTFVNLDLNGNIIDNLWGKIYTEAVSYIEELWKQASQNYQQQLV